MAPLDIGRYNHKTGEWAHTTRLTRFPERKWISNFSLGSETVNPPHSSKQAGTAAEAGRGAAVGDDGHGPPAFPGPSPMQEALASWGVSALAELFSSVQRAAAAEADKAAQAIAKQAKKRGGGGGGGFGTAASSGAAAAAAAIAAAAVPSFARAGGAGLDDANLDGTELGGMEAIRWFVLAEDIAVEGGSSSDSSGPVKGQSSSSSCSCRCCYCCRRRCCCCCCCCCCCGNCSSSYYVVLLLLLLLLLLLPTFQQDYYFDLVRFLGHHLKYRPLGTQYCILLLWVGG